MREEFHGSNGAPYKQLYGWGTINVNVWLPSLSELVGTDPDHYHDPYGCYFSAMQGLNISSYWYVDAQGGNQFAYFKQYNASGGGEKIWSACKQKSAWTRSCTMDTSQYTWRITNAQQFDWGDLAAAYAVHPAVR